MKKNQDMTKFLPALGIIFGAPIGSLFGIVSNQNIGVYTAIGAGIGLVVGAIIYNLIYKK